MTTAPCLVRLSRPVATLEIEFSGSVLVPAQRDDLLILLIALVEHGGEMTAAELGEHLFGPGRAGLARQLLNTALRNGVVSCPGDDGLYALTPTGVESLAEGMVSVPKYGVWRLVVVDDGWSPHSVLRLEQRNGRTLHEAVSGAAPGATLMHAQRRLPGWAMEPIRPAGAKGTWRIIEVGAADLPTSMRDGEFRLHWDVTTNEVSIGRRDGTKVASVDATGERSVPSVLQALLPASGWDDASSSLTMPPDALTLREVEEGMLRRTLTGISIRDARLGEFDEALIEGIPLRPRGRADAQEWLERRLIGRVERLATQSAWNTWLDESSQALADWGVVTPTRSALAADPRLDVARRWRLRAPEDWDV